VVLAGGLDAEMVAIGAAADELNHRLARALGLRSFSVSRGGHAFMRLAERISALQTPEIGSTRAQIEVAAAEWQRRFEELTR
jgi:hypothetical protein